MRYMFFATDGSTEIDIAFESTSAIQDEQIHAALESAAAAIIDRLAATYPTVRPTRSYEGALQGEPWPAP